jgi:hypothetical protein
MARILLPLLRDLKGELVSIEPPNRPLSRIMLPCRV